MAGMSNTRMIAIDVGGTFTDIAEAGTGTTWVARHPRRPATVAGVMSGGDDSA